MSQIILLAILIAILNLASGSPTLVNGVGEKLQNVYTSAESEEKAIKHKTTTLLAEALQMIQKSKDIKERRWLESFVQRLAKLASDLERNSGNKALEQIKRENEVIINSKEKMPLVIDSGTREPDEFDSQMKEPEISAMIAEQQTKMLPTVIASEQPESTVITEKLHRVVLEEQVSERNSLLKQILKKIHKLKDLGGTQQDVMKLLKKSEHEIDSVKDAENTDFEEEEEGAAAGELESDTDLSTLAPSLGHTSNTKKPNDDDLVKQLEEEKFLLVTTDVTGRDEDILRRINGLVAPSVV